MKYKLNNEWVDINIKALDSMPIGSIILFAGYHTIPTGWLVCDGSVMDKYDEANFPLFAAIGYTYGNDGQNFKLPDLRGRVPVGLKSSDTDFDTLGETGGSKYLQQHSHTTPTNYVYDYSEITGGAGAGLANWNPGATHIGSTTMTSNNAGSGNSGNLQPYQVLNYIIKAYNTVPTMANVVNTRSESFVETYSTFMVNSMISGTTLYSNSSGTTGNITLNDSLDNYKTFKIYTLDNENSSSSLGIFEFDTSKTKFTLSGSGIGSTLSVYTKEYTKGTNELTSSTGKLYQVSSGSITNYEVFKVYKVVGYK